MRKKGRVTVYSNSVSAGLIQGEDRKIYPFKSKSWKSEKPPEKDMVVSFLADAEASEVEPEKY